MERRRGSQSCSVAVAATSLLVIAAAAVDAIDNSCIRPGHIRAPNPLPCDNSRKNFQAILVPLSTTSFKTQGINVTLSLVDNLLEIYNITTNAPWDASLRKHVFYRYEKTVFCMSGRATGITEPVQSLQGALHSLSYVVVIPVKLDHCDIQKDACQVISPPCGSHKEGFAIVPGQDFCLCGELQVPDYAVPGVRELRQRIKPFCTRSGCASGWSHLLSLRAILATGRGKPTENVHTYVHSL